MTDLELEGKVLALLVSAPADGEEEVAVIGGVVRRDGERLFIDRGPAHERLFLRDDWKRRIAPVEKELREQLPRADFYLRLSAGSLRGRKDLEGMTDQ
jgi:hypothetical protein